MSSRLASAKRPLRYVMGLSYVVAGVLHFVAPETYERIVPPQFPRPRTLVALSGPAEIALGVGVDPVMGFIVERSCAAGPVLGD